MMPLEKADANTTTSGRTTNTVRKLTASAMMMKRTGPGSVRRFCGDGIACGRTPSLREGGEATLRSVVGA